MLPRRRTRTPRRPGRGRSGGRRAVATLTAGALLATLGGTGAGAASGATGAQANPAPADADQPLRIDLDTLTPAVIPRSGEINVTGLVTNVSDDVWTDVNLYAFSGEEAITTGDELATAVQTGPDVEVGPRVIAPGTFDAVGDLEPEESSGFSLRVPRSALAVPDGEPGVYWFGVHALGSSVDGRDGVADGRARTFLAQLDQQSKQLPVSLVLPLRRPVSHAADGSLDRLEGWTRALEPGGRLRRLLDFGAFASDRALTWLADPAVLDAADQLALGNPPRSITPTQPVPADEGSGATPGDDSSRSGDSADSGGDSGGGSGDSGSGGSSGGGSGDSGDSDPGSPDRALSGPERQAAGLAKVWALRTRGLLRQGEVLALPYADLDVGAAMIHEPGIYESAATYSMEAFGASNLPSTPAFAPPDGRTDPETLAGLAEGTVTLLSDGAVEDAAEGSVREIAGHDVILLDDAAAAGGPGPDAPLGTVQVRQRLLAETALRSLAGDDSPTAVVLAGPSMPDDARGFFLGIDDAPWVRLATLGAATGGQAEKTDPGALVYPEEAALDRVGRGNLASVRALNAAGSLLQEVLSRNDQVAGVVAREALSGASYPARERRVYWRRINRRSLGWIQARLNRVRVEAPPSVTLSGEEGKFAARLANDLDEPVTVLLEARTDSPVEVSAPEAVSLAPGERTSVLLTASTDRIGLHDVELVVTGLDGVALGSSTELPIRSAQVSWIIWVVIAAGGSVLFGAIAVRISRRVRRTRGEHGATPAPEGA